LFVIHRPEEVFQVGVHDPFPTCFDFLPHFPQSVFRRPPSPISKVGFVEYRFEDRFQSIQQRLLTYPIVNRRDSQHTMLAWLAALRDARLPHGFGVIAVVSKLHVKLIETLKELLAECFNAFSVDSSAPMIGFDALPGDLQILPLVHLVDQRVDLPRSRRIDPICESPRAMIFGSFTQGIFHFIVLAHPASFLSPTVFASWLPRPTRSPRFWSRDFHRASGNTQPSDYSQGAASLFAFTYRVASLDATRGPREF